MFKAKAEAKAEVKHLARGLRISDVLLYRLLSVCGFKDLRRDGWSASERGRISTESCPEKRRNL